MNRSEDLTLIDLLPLGALALLALVAIIGVFRGMNRPPDGRTRDVEDGGGGGTP